MTTDNKADAIGETGTQKHSRPKDSYLELNNLPNRLTLFRILLIPVVIGCLYINTTSLLSSYHALLGWIAGWTFGLAAITDYFDGYFARKRNIVTVFGSFLDPIADKFLVISSLIMLLALSRVHWFVVIILVLREVYMTSLRLLASAEGISVPVNDLGKWKTTLQMIGVPFIMAYETTSYGMPMGLLGKVFLYIACLFSVISALRYTIASLNRLKEIRMQKKQD